MDPLRAAYEELERAFGSAQFTTSANIGSVQSDLTLSVRPTDFNASDSDDEDESHILFHDKNTYSVLSREAKPANLSLPPTPPSLGTEEDTESEQSRTPKFSQRNPVSGGLHSRSSGLNSSGVNWHTLPTPESSPPSTRENILFPLYQLGRNPSSYADSFITAKETLSAADSMSTSQVHSPTSETFSNPTTSKPVNVANMGLPRQDVELGNPRSDGSNDDESRVKNDRHESNIESRVRRHSAMINAQSTLDSVSASSTLARAESQGAAQRRLRTVIQPGDSLTRPDESLLYINHSSPTVRKVSHGRALESREVADANSIPIQEESSLSPPMATFDPKKELEQLNDPDQMLDTNGNEDNQVNNVDETNNTDHLTDIDQHDTMGHPGNIDQPDISAQVSSANQVHNANKIKGTDGIRKSDFNESVDRAENGTHDATAQRAREPRTPPSVTRSSLEDNNVVYKLIRDENVKRHSNISDGSVPAMVVALPEYKRTLRHTPKRHSLRGDASLRSNSHRSSAESGPKSTKRHTGTTFSASETDLTSVDVSPIAQKAALQSASISQIPPEVGVGAMSPHERRFEQEPSSRTRNPSRGIHSVKTQLTQSPTLQHSALSDNLDRTDTLHAKNSVNMRRSGSPPLHQAAHMSSKPVYVPLMALQTSPKLRRLSNESRLENNQQIMRSSFGKELHRGSKPLEIKLEQAARDFSREGQELPDDRLSIGMTSALTSPKQGSFDMHSHHRTHTSFSFSQVSMRSDVELLEARGVTIFPHNNESLLVVQQSVPGKGKGAGLDGPSTGTTADSVSSNRTELTVGAQLRVQGIDVIGKPQHTVESPLTNPRAPPEPPIIKFIPPTPSDELEPDLSPTKTEEIEVSVPQRWPSLSRRMRRYSENLIQPLGFARFGSLRRQHQAQQRKRASTLPNDRPTHLSSFWQPRDFWEEYDSDSDSDVELIDADDPTGARYAVLPPGGDTSNIGSSNDRGNNASRAAAFFPRQLSVRMPGFRGTGGFLLGNSLGIDRHGTNSRRPYVRPLTREELLRRPHAHHIASDEELTRFFSDHRRRRRRTFTLPFSRGTRVEYVGLAYFRAQIQSLRTRREQAALERRRDDLRSRIGTHFYHDANHVSS